MDNPRYHDVYMNAHKDLTRWKHASLRPSHQTKPTQHKLSINMAMTMNMQLTNAIKELSIKSQSTQVVNEHG